MIKHKPENYLYWLKGCARLPIPMLQDFEGAVEAIKDLLVCFLKFWSRMLILVLFPVSVPLLAYLCWKLNIKAVERRNKAQKDVIESLQSISQKEVNNETS